MSHTGWKSSFGSPFWGSSLRKLAAAGLAASLLAGCTAEVAVRGHVPEIEAIAEIMPGVDTRQDVITRLGTPSAISTFEDFKWYYIGQKEEQVAFYWPEVVDRSVLVVAFNDDGYVEDTRLYTMNDGRDITPVSRVTPTEGTELTLMQQLFGNLGRLPGGIEAQELPPGTRTPRP